MAGGGGLACVDLHVLSLLPRTLGSQYASFVDPGNMSEEKELDALRCIFNSRVKFVLLFSRDASFSAFHFVWELELTDHLIYDV